YRPTTPQDGKFHEIGVKAKRPGVAVRARRGYVATLRPSPTLAEPIESAPARATETSAPVEPISRVDSESPPRPADPVEGRVTGAAPSGGFRVRPDGGKHVEMLLRDQKSDEAARDGWEAYERGDVATARTSLAIAAASPGAQPWVHYALGMAEYAMREYREAAGEWEKVRQAAPEFEPVYFDLVDSYLQLKEHDQAARLLRTARERWPRDP